MKTRIGALLIALSALVAPLPAAAQGYDPYGYDHRPPPRPRPPDDYGYRPPPPPPPDDYGYRPPPPPYTRFGGFGGPGGPDGPMMCRTEEGSCRPHGPRFFRARCFCDFGDGPVSGRVKP